MKATTRLKTHGLGLIDDRKKKLWHEEIVTNIWRCRKKGVDLQRFDASRLLGESSYSKKKTDETVFLQGILGQY